MRKLVLTISSVVCSLFVIAQSKGNLSVRIINEQKSSLENATIELIKSKDSSLARTAITDKNGSAEIDNISFGSYLVKVSMVNHATQYSNVFTLSAEQPGIRLPEITLLPRATDIGGVTVTSRKPFIQRLTDRIVVNVENSIVNAGSSAMDVLERSPGVRVGQNDAISLAGKPGVIIMINGKNVPMSGEELGNYLRSLPSSAIERIDLITNPSARYDAAGNAGIIDIRMKKDQKLGANGTLSATYGQGNYPKQNAGATFNYRSKKLNIYGNLNQGYGKQFNNILTDRYFFDDDGTYTGSYDQDNNIFRVHDFLSGRLGADYYISNKTVIGVLLNGSGFWVDRFGDNQSLVLDQSDTKQSSFLTRADGEENYGNYVANINVKHTFDSTGKELTADFDFGTYDRDWESFFSTGYYDANNIPIQDLFRVRTKQDGLTDINTLKIDYVNPFKKDIKLETGIKTSFVKSNNDIMFYDRSNGPEELDSSQSNKFRYNENINAAYFNLSKEWKKFNAQVGLRAEQTNIKTVQVFDGAKFDTTYLRLFPSAFFNYKIKEDQTIGVSVSRRIDRPGYNSLNPFRIFVDPSFYAAGDPLLKPAFTWSYELSYTRKQISIAVNYSHTSNPLTYVLIPSETQDRVTIQTPINLVSFDYFGVNFNTPLRITKWWNVINNGNIYYGYNKGYIAKTVVNSKTLNAQFSTNHNITIKDGLTAEVNFNFDSGNNTGVMKDKFFWILGAGVQKTLFAKKATLRFNVTDILYRQWPRFRSIYKNYHEYLEARRDTRVAYVTLTYRFGRNTIQQARRRTTASEEERRRAG